MNWAEWAPTLVSVAVGLYMTGVEVGARREMRRTQVAQGKSITKLDDRMVSVEGRVSAIEGWRSGVRI